MDVPDNATDVAWYKHGPRPGDSGSAVLAAHVDLVNQGPGVFFDLRTLEEGDRVTVINSDGTENAFRVLARVVYDKGELPLDVIFSRQGPPVLTLITCGGDFNSRVRSYDSNVVVYAVPDGAEQIVPGSSL
jgi:LPXTG-site transpeptidase (sortase) family protein